MLRPALAALLVFAACSAPASPRQERTVSGTGNAKSAPVELAGNYSVTWSLGARPPKCTAILTLESPTDKGIYEVLVNDEVATSGATNVYGLDAGPYYVNGDLNDCGPWSVVLTPQP